MARFVKVGERIFNLDQVKCFERKKGRGGNLVVDVFFDAGKIAPMPDDLLQGVTLNLRFAGADAKLVWEKLCEMSEVWGLPDEMPDA